MVPMAEVKQLEEEMAMLLRDAQAKVAGLQSQVQALEAARDGARIQESDERVNKLLTSVHPALPSVPLCHIRACESADGLTVARAIGAIARQPKATCVLDALH